MQNQTIAEQKHDQPKIDSSSLVRQVARVPMPNDFWIEGFHLQTVGHARHTKKAQSLDRALD
jgi:hypothetical protein